MGGDFMDRASTHRFPRTVRATAGDPSRRTRRSRAAGFAGAFLLGCGLLSTACRPQEGGDSFGVIAVFGGRGLADGKFSYPRAVAAEPGPGGSLFVVDKTGRIQRFAPDGTFELGWTMPAFEAGKPVGLTVHPDGRLFVADTHYHRVVVFDRTGRLLATFGKEGRGDGEFLLPTDVAVDEDGWIYVSEYQGNDRITVWRPDLSFDRVLIAGTVGGKPLRRPAGIDFDREQTLWVADACNHRILGISREGKVRKVFGEFGEAPGQLRYPYDLDVTPEDTLLVCEYGGNRLQWFDKQGRSLRVWGRPGRKPGELFAPWGATYGPGGNVYVVDSLNNRVQVVRP
ncbi:MAG: 6-bladed beta-propeller [Planctomycetota bacterium]|nr:MAG: 6-bladed beta-propeller [Planctomycetota bacterium]